MRATSGAMLVLTALLYAPVSQAAASDYCVGASGACGGGGFAADGTGLSDAISAASAHPGPDRVLVGPGRFTQATGKKPRRCTRLLAAGALMRRGGAGAQRDSLQRPRRHQGAPAGLPRHTASWAFD